MIGLAPSIKILGLSKGVKHMLWGPRSDLDAHIHGVCQTLHGLGLMMWSGQVCIIRGDHRAGVSNTWLSVSGSLQVIAVIIAQTTRTSWNMACFAKRASIHFMERSSSTYLFSNTSCCLVCNKTNNLFIQCSGIQSKYLDKFYISRCRSGN